MERLHPVEDGQVVREIIPGGHEPRELVLYPDTGSVQWAQRLDRSRFVPRFVVALLDEGMPIGEDALSDRIDKVELSEKEVSRAA